MTDDYNARYRSQQPYGGAQGQGGHPNDPLAELARLIGQNDPFSDNRQAPPQQNGYDPSFGGSGYGQAANAPAQAHGYPDQHYPEQHYAEQHYPAQTAPEYNAPAPSYAPVSGAYPGAVSQPYQAPAPHPFYDTPSQSYAASAPQHYPQGVADWHSTPAYPPANGHDSFAAPQAAPAYAPHPGYDGYQQPAAAYGEAPQAYPPQGALPSPHADDFYDDAPGGHRRGLITVAAVLGLAVVGTAGAFAYRSVFSGGGPLGVPPLIRASIEPTKVAPPPQPLANDAGKISYDRFADSGQNERVASREERPIDAATLARQAPPPPPVQPVPQAATPPAQAQAPAAPPSVLTEPRRVRTERIRPEAEARPAVPPMAPPQRQAAAAPPQADSDLPPPPRSAAPRSQPPAPQQSGGPLSLSPDANASAAAQPAPRQTASAGNSRMRLASVPSGGSGGFLVQITSQKSEADAQSAFRGLQSKYSSVLGGKPLVIRRADLGDKGVYYRAMVGPFGTRDQAVQLCTSLKAAGGNCLIQTN